MADDDRNEDRLPGSTPDAGKADLRARFATPMEADQPVNPDETSDVQFTPPPPAEQSARDAEDKQGRT